MKRVRLQREIDVLKECDVAIIGGGPAGIGAAVSASRQGLKVLLVEKRGFLGGNITASYVENCNYFLRNTPFVSEGLYREIEEGCYRQYGNDNLRSYNKYAFSSEYLKLYLDRLFKREGIEILFHSFVNEVIVDEGNISAVIVQTKQGPQAVVAKQYIDATGDGDVAFASGVGFDQGRDTDHLCQPGTVSLRLSGANVDALLNDRDGLSEIGRQFKIAYRNGETGLACKRQDLPFGRLTGGGVVSYVNYSCAYGLDPTAVEDLSRGEMECRSYVWDIYDYLKRNHAELSGIEIASIAPEIGFRDSRRIHGHYRLTIEDMETNRQFDDVIAVFPRFYDMLAPDAYMDGDGSVEGGGYHGHIYETVKDERTFTVPYRSLLPQGVDNLLVAGRCISCDHVAQSGIRAISLCMMTGQGAGVGAALAVQTNVRPSDIDIAELQRRLKVLGLTIPTKEA